jgi:DNA polymerase III gamma/tau subunit
MLLARVDRERLLKLLELITEGGAKEIIKLMEGLIQEGIELSWLAKDVAWWFKNLLFMKLSTQFGEILELEEHVIERLKNLSSCWEEEELLRALDILMELQERMRRTQDQHILFFTKILQCCLIKRGGAKIPKEEKEGLLDRTIQVLKEQKPYLATSLAVAEERVEDKKLVLLFHPRYQHSYMRKVLEEKLFLEEVLSRLALKRMEVVVQQKEEEEEEEPLIEKAIKMFDAEVVSG